MPTVQSSTSERRTTTAINTPELLCEKRVNFIKMLTNQRANVRKRVNERVPILRIVFHTLIGHNKYIVYVTFETECKWYVRRQNQDIHATYQMRATIIYLAFSCSTMSFTFIGITCLRLLPLQYTHTQTHFGSRLFCVWLSFSLHRGRARATLFCCSLELLPINMHAKFKHSTKCYANE